MAFGSRVDPYVSQVLLQKDKPNRGVIKKRRASREPILPTKSTSKSLKADSNSIFPSPKGTPQSVHYHYHATGMTGMRRRSVGGTEYLVQEMQNGWPFQGAQGWSAEVQQIDSVQTPKGKTGQSPKKTASSPVQFNYVPKALTVPQDVEDGKRYLQPGAMESEVFFNGALLEKQQRQRKPGPPPNLMDPTVDRSALAHHMKRKQLEIENNWDGLVANQDDSEPSTPQSVRQMRYDNLSYSQFAEIKELNDLIRQQQNGVDEKLVKEIQAMHDQYIAVSKDIQNLESHERGSMRLPLGIQRTQSPSRVCESGTRSSQVAAIKGSLASPSALPRSLSPTSLTSHIQSPSLKGEIEVPVGVFTPSEKAAMSPIGSARSRSRSPTQPTTARSASPVQEILFSAQARSSSPAQSILSQAIARSRSPASRFYLDSPRVGSIRAESPRSQPESRIGTILRAESPQAESLESPVASGGSPRREMAPPIDAFDAMIDEAARAGSPVASVRATFPRSQVSAQSIRQALVAARGAVSQPNSPR